MSVVTQIYIHVNLTDYACKFRQVELRSLSNGSEELCISMYLGVLEHLAREVDLLSLSDLIEAYISLHEM